MTASLVAHAGVDDASMAWSASFVAGCRGFALRRRIRRAEGSPVSPNAVGAADAQGFVEEIVASWVGFADGPDFPPGTRKPTTEWPIQKYLWTDYMVAAGDTVRYRVAPVIRDAAGQLAEQEDQASDWSEAIVIGPRRGKGLSCYFNRGIVASQWLSRLLPESASDKNRKLRTIIATPGDRTRNFLGGPVREKLLTLLGDADAAKAHVYAALYELDDPELIEALKALKKRAHIVLANGSVDKAGEDQNADGRAEITGVCDVHDRFCSPRALGHNKFLVICDSSRSPLAVWTGSTNWTKTGLCTQANNAVLVEDKGFASEYLDQWNLLKKAGDVTPPELVDSNERPRTSRSFRNTTLFFTPGREQIDLVAARQKIMAARQGILFLMFNPGPRGTLLSDIIERASPSGSAFDPELYIQGVVNQNPGTEKNPVTLFHRGERSEANADVAIPAAIDERLKFWLPELKKLAKTFAMVHSKVVVVDPFGDAPVVMTGSHNLGPKASGVNDENFLIFEGNRSLAEAYASNIMAIYNQYRWRFRMMQNPDQPKFNGLADNDTWQIDDRAEPLRDYDKRRLREIDFWFGRR